MNNLLNSRRFWCFSEPLNDRFTAAEAGQFLRVVRQVVNCSELIMPNSCKACNLFLSTLIVSQGLWPLQLRCRFFGCEWEWGLLIKNKYKTLINREPYWGMALGRGSTDRGQRFLGYIEKIMCWNRLFSAQHIPSSYCHWRHILFRHL